MRVSCVDVSFRSLTSAAMRWQVSDGLRVVRHGAGPLGDGERRALECRGAPLAYELFHERAGSAGVRLERPRDRLAVAEWRERRLLWRLWCGRGALGKCAGAEPERARGGGDE